MAETEAERKEREAERRRREALKKKVAATNKNSSQNLARPPWPRPVGRCGR